MRCECRANACQHTNRNRGTAHVVTQLELWQTLNSTKFRFLSLHENAYEWKCSGQRDSNENVSGPVALLGWNAPFNYDYVRTATSCQLPLYPQRHLLGTMQHKRTLPGSVTFVITSSILSLRTWHRLLFWRPSWVWWLIASECDFNSFPSKWTCCAQSIRLQSNWNAIDWRNGRGGEKKSVKRNVKGTI